MSVESDPLVREPARVRTVSSLLQPLAPKAHPPAEGPCRNLLLREFGQAVLSRLMEGASMIELTAGDRLIAVGQKVDTVYFPDSGALSLASTAGEGATVEGAIIGTEGAVGLAEGMSGEPAPWTCRVILPGMAWAAPSELVSETLRWDPAAGNAAWRYMARLSAAQHGVLACSALHSGAERLARALLEWSDRTGSDRLPLTQEKLSGLLGLRRTTITVLMAQLTAEALVDTGRGRVMIVDRDGLERRACACRLKSRIARSAEAR